MAPIIPFIPLIVAGATAAATGIELSRQPTPPKPPTPLATNTQQAQAAQASALAQAQALTRRRGEQSTILTGPQGITGGTETKSTTLGA